MHFIYFEERKKIGARRCTLSMVHQSKVKHKQKHTARHAPTHHKTFYCTDRSQAREATYGNRGTNVNNKTIHNTPPPLPKFYQTHLSSPPSPFPRWRRPDDDRVSGINVMGGGRHHRRLGPILVGSCRRPIVPSSGEADAHVEGICTPWVSTTSR